MPWGPLRIENEMNNEAKRESEPAAGVGFVDELSGLWAGEPANSSAQRREPNQTTPAKSE